jgi:hypothetical protein
MDDDPVLRSLSADVERDDPALAAFLAGHPAHRHSSAWLLLVLPLLIPALLLPGRVTLGLLATLLILASPVMVCWLCAGIEGGASPRT